MDVLVEIIYAVAGMTWKIAWGLVLGFAISAVIQAFVSKQKIGEHLGSFNLKSVTLATGFGAASSSCSYAAAAMSKTLFKKGAHITNATAFLFASTNLVLEIGLVIWALLGWRFVAAEFVGGVLLIGVVALLLKWVAPKRLFEQAREHLEQKSTSDEHEHHHEGEALPWSKLLSAEGMTATGRYFAMDWSMVGKDIALGLVIAGTLHAVMPQEWWQTLFPASASERGIQGSGSRSRTPSWAPHRDPLLRLLGG